MKWTRRSLIELIASILMIAAVLVLAILQYRWTGEISRSEQNRLEGVLTSSVRNFNQDFSYDFERLCEGFEVLPLPAGADVSVAVAQQYASWYKSTTRPAMISGLYIWKLEYASSASSPLSNRLTLSNEPQFMDESRVLNPKEQRPRKAPLSPKLDSLRKFLIGRAAELQPAMPDRQAEYYPWLFFADAPALVRPLFEISSDESALTMTARPVAFLIVEINEGYLKQNYLPALVDRDFSRDGFDVAIRSASPPYDAVYESTPSFPVATSSPDASFYLLDSVGEEARRRGHPSVLPANEARQWQLVALHSSGSLDQAVTDWRHRNLTISFGLLAILAGTLVLVFSVARRAERFAELQMEFVAGVSHELFTPLAVINSAVENLADGVVDTPGQIEEYVGILRDQGGRLEGLLNQVLQFASGRSSRSEFELHPVEIGAIVGQSIAVSEPMLRDAGFTMEQKICPDLPLVDADPGAVHKCVQNLISNAIKYGGASRWISVGACLDRTQAQPEVQVAVEDKGMGISPRDLRKIFEPFYRAQKVRDGQFRGVGLGLYLVKGMMEAMGGSITVSSEAGRGTRFVLHFPVSSSAKRSQQTPA